MLSFFKWVKKRPVIAAFPIVAGVVLLSSPAEAVDIDVQAEIAKVEAVAGMLASVVVAFTGVLITPMGISASAKIFKTLVLFKL